jgi:RNA polymerase sigma factor (TIGR02999 family)
MKSDADADRSSIAPQLRDQSGGASDGATGLTTLLVKMRRGDPVAADRAMNAVYSEVYRIAQRCMSGEKPQHLLQPTALVHEAYLRLMRGPEEIADRYHFYALAAQAMRRVLVDHARRKRAEKRGGAAVHLNLDDHSMGSGGSRKTDVLAVHEALEQLSKLDSRAERVIELRFFGGYTETEVSEILGESFAAVRRHWEFGRAWLKHKLESSN